MVSVSFPALGTRYRHHPAKTTAQGMLSGIEEFSKSHTSTSVKQIHILIYGDRHTEISKVKSTSNVSLSWYPIDVSNLISDNLLCRLSLTNLSGIKVPLGA